MELPRRRFLYLAAGAVAALLVMSRMVGEQASPTQVMPTIGYFHLSSPDLNVAAFRKGLNEAGYVDGRDVRIEYRFAHTEADRLPELAADLVRRRVAVIVAPGSADAALAAKAATKTIPIVFATASDPVQLGLVASLSNPGGNVTGISMMNVELAAKQSELLHELLPLARRFAVLVNPIQATTAPFIRKVEAAAAGFGVQIEVLSVRDNHEISTAIASLDQKRVDALLVGSGLLFNSSRVQLADLAKRYALPAIYTRRENVEAGGLMSFGSNLSDQFRQTGVYTGRILKGEKPANLPVVQPTKFEFLINLQTAKLLGLTVPRLLLMRADEVIE